MTNTIAIVSLAVNGVILALPFFQWLAKLTATSVDDEAVAAVATFVHDLLAAIPQLRPGQTLDQVTKGKKNELN